MEIPVVYQDSDLLVVDKPAGLLVHPAKQPKPSLVDFARRHTSDPDPDRPGIVHRLDQDTSGLVVIAKTPAAKLYLQKLFKDRLVHKTYLALVEGHPRQPTAIIRLPIRRQPGHPSRRQVAKTGRPSETRYRVLAQYGPFSLLELEPKSGRTHQLRVHLSYLGHPIVGDRLYGHAQPGLERQFLHAAKIKFSAPDGRTISAESPLPPELQHFLSQLKV